MAKALFALIICLCATLSPLSAHSAPTPKKSPTWSDLTADQRGILAPLSNDWDALDSPRKKKWIGIAKRYPSMTAAEQEKVQRRMQDWAKLSPEQRRTAREGFKNIAKLPPEKKQSLRDKWEEYQQLPEEEREKLRSTQKTKKAVVRPPASSISPANNEPSRAATN